MARGEKELPLKEIHSEEPADPVKARVRGLQEKLAKETPPVSLASSAGNHVIRSNDKNTQTINFISKLLEYILIRNAELKAKKSIYNSIFGYFTSMSAPVKISAAFKTIDYLQGKTSKPFTELELDAIRDRRLGRIFAFYQKKGVLPQELVSQENAYKRREMAGQDERINCFMMRKF